MKDVVKKKSVFMRVIGLIGRIFRRGREKEGIRGSYFMYMLDGTDKDSDLYANALHVVQLCDRAVSVVSQRLMLIKRLSSLEENISQLECFNRLTNDEAEKLKSMLDRMVSLMRDRNVLKNQMEGFDRSLAYMQNIESDAKAAMSEIRAAEEKQRTLKQDLAYLESENSELEYERENLGLGQRFIYGLTMTLIFVFGGAVLLLGYFYFFGNIEVMSAAVVICSLLILIFAIMYAFRRRIKFELELNIKKQHRAAELINKKTAVYAHYTNFLNYEYSKYKVRNSDMLKETISEYNLYKHLSARLESIRSILFQTEKEIEDFLSAKELTDVVRTIESFALNIDIGSKRQHHKELVTEKKGLLSKLEQLDSEHENIWDKLTVYQQAEPGGDGLVEAIIKECIEETGRIINSADRDQKKSSRLEAADVSRA